jgi:hypothetical protein
MTEQRPQIREIARAAARQTAIDNGDCYSYDIADAVAVAVVDELGRRCEGMVFISEFYELIAKEFAPPAVEVTPHE